MSTPQFEQEVRFFLKPEHPAHAWLQKTLRPAGRIVRVTEEGLMDAWGRLREEERQVLRLRLGMNEDNACQSFQEIAATLDLAGASQASTLRDRARERIYYRLVVWPGEQLTGISDELRDELEAIGIRSLRDMEVLSLAKRQGIVKIRGLLQWELIEHLVERDQQELSDRIRQLILGSYPRAQRRS